MKIPGFEMIDELERQHAPPHGKPTLGQSYSLLMERWNKGIRDRETALRLLFLTWFHVADMSGMSGLDDVELTEGRYREFLDVASNNGPADGEDEELWFVTYVMTEVAAFAFLSDEEYWTQLGEEAADRLGERRNFMDPKIFEGRGAYGRYFAHQARTATELELEWQAESQALVRDRRKDN